MTDVVDTLQAALRGEHAAVYGYGSAAGALTGTQLASARLLLDAHRTRRERLRALVAATGATPAAASPSYAVPVTTTPAQGRTVLAGIESRLASVYADLVAAATGEARTLAVNAMRDCVVRSATWGAVVNAFPGLPERTATGRPTAASRRG